MFLPDHFHNKEFSYEPIELKNQNVDARALLNNGKAKKCKDNGIWFFTWMQIARILTNTKAYKSHTNAIAKQ